MFCSCGGVVVVVVDVVESVVVCGVWCVVCCVLCGVVLCGVVCCGVVFVGWVGRGSTTLHCTHHTRCTCSRIEHRDCQSCFTSITLRASGLAVLTTPQTGETIFYLRENIKPFVRRQGICVLEASAYQE